MVRSIYRAVQPHPSEWDAPRGSADGTSALPPIEHWILDIPYCSTGIDIARSYAMIASSLFSS